MEDKCLMLEGMDKLFKKHAPCTTKIIKGEESIPIKMKRPNEIWLLDSKDRKIRYVRQNSSSEEKIQMRKKGRNKKENDGWLSFVFAPKKNIGCS